MKAALSLLAALTQLVSSAPTPDNAVSGARATDASCTGPVSDPGQPYWYGQMTHNGLSSFNAYASTYPIFRDVTSSPYSADNTGASDASGAIQKAINGKQEARFIDMSLNDENSWRCRWSFEDSE
jgi:glucan 1,3-beta-glucosidase